jgi:hypothetical protein
VTLTCGVGTLGPAAKRHRDDHRDPHATGTMSNAVVLRASGYTFTNTASASVTVG